MGGKARGCTLLLVAVCESSTRAIALATGFIIHEPVAPRETWNTRQRERATCCRNSDATRLLSSAGARDRRGSRFMRRRFGGSALRIRLSGCGIEESETAGRGRYHDAISSRVSISATTICAEYESRLRSQGLANAYTHTRGYAIRGHVQTRVQKSDDEKCACGANGGECSATGTRAAGCGMQFRAKLRGSVSRRCRLLCVGTRMREGERSAR